MKKNSILKLKNNFYGTSKVYIRMNLFLEDVKKDKYRYRTK